MVENEEITQQVNNNSGIIQQETIPNPLDPSSLYKNNAGGIYQFNVGKTMVNNGNNNIQPIGTTSQIPQTTYINPIQYMYPGPMTYIINSSNIQPISSISYQSFQQQLPLQQQQQQQPIQMQNLIPNNPTLIQNPITKPQQMQPFQFQSQLQNNNTSPPNIYNQINSNNSTPIQTSQILQSPQQQILMSINPQVVQFQQQTLATSPPLSSQALPNSNAPPITINQTQTTPTILTAQISSAPNTPSTPSNTTSIITNTKVEENVPKRKRGRPPKLNKDGTPVNPNIVLNSSNSNINSNSNNSQTSTSSSEQSSPSANSPTQSDKNKSRAIYLCNKCKLPKKGHSCSNKSSGDQSEDDEDDDDESLTKKKKSEHDILQQSETILNINLPDMGVPIDLNSISTLEDTHQLNDSNGILIQSPNYDNLSSGNQISSNINSQPHVLSPPSSIFIDDQQLYGKEEEFDEENYEEDEDN